MLAECAMRVRFEDFEQIWSETELQDLSEFNAESQKEHINLKMDGSPLKQILKLILSSHFGIKLKHCELHYSWGCRRSWAAAARGQFNLNGLVVVVEDKKFLNWESYYGTAVFLPLQKKIGTP